MKNRVIRFSFASIIVYVCLGALACTPSAPSTVETPAFSPAGGEYSSTQQIHITSSTPSAAVYYSWDGVPPTSTTGTLYSAPFSISSSYTIMAIASRVGWIDSEVVSADYSIAPAGALYWWKAAASLTIARCGHSSAVSSNHVYVMGGDGAAGRLDEVSFAAINTDGSLGSWQATTSLPIANRYQASVAYNGYIYVLGGNGTGAILKTVSYAPINSDGSLGPWAAATSFLTQVYEESCVAYNGYLYALGGGFTHSTVAEFAKINSDGSLGTWTSTTSLSTPRTRHASAVCNGRVYLIGGDDGAGNDVLSVTCAVINADGTLGSWQNAGALNSGRMRPAAESRNGFLYISGGSGSYNALVEYAPVSADGSLGAFAAATNRGGYLDGLSSALSGRYLYLMGGLASVIVADVEYAKISE